MTSRVAVRIAVLCTWTLVVGCGDDQSSKADAAITVDLDAASPDNAAPDADPVYCPAREILEGRALTQAGTVHSPNVVAASETWRAADSPHILGGYGLTVGSGATLTIEPCSVVIVPKQRGLKITGAAGNPARLVAEGTADRPIVFTGQQKSAGAWNGLAATNGNSELSLTYATVEYAGYSVVAKEGASLFAESAKPVLNHVTVRDGAGTGVVLRRQAEFGPGTQALTVERVEVHPIETCQVGARSIPAGSYSNNGDNRFLIRAYGAGVPAAVGPVTWPNRGLPYVYDVGSYQGWSTPLTLERGLRVQVRHDTTGRQGRIIIDDQGALIANGQDEAGRIVIEGDGKPWEGLFFALDVNNPSRHAGPSTLNFVTIKDAGSIPISASTPICTPVDGTVKTAAILLQLDCLTMTNTIIQGAGASSYGVGRYYCGSGAPRFSVASLNNVFKGPMLCAESDQDDCDPCTALLKCCNHDMACHGTVQ